VQIDANAYLYFFEGEITKSQFINEDGNPSGSGDSFDLQITDKQSNAPNLSSGYFEPANLEDDPIITDTPTRTLLGGVWNFGGAIVNENNVSFDDGFLTISDSGNDTWNLNLTSVTLADANYRKGEFVWNGQITIITSSDFD